MSTVQADVYDAPATVTPNGTGAADPQGPFTALFVVTGGTLSVYPHCGPLVGTAVPLGTLVAGNYVRFPVRAVATGGSATVLGLTSPLFRQGTG
jgi:hypothetical protein